MKIEILDEAQQDSIEGFHFCEKQEAGLGPYFLDCLISDIDSLLLHAGIHRIVHGLPPLSVKAFSVRDLLSSRGRRGSCTRRA